MLKSEEAQKQYLFTVENCSNCSILNKQDLMSFRGWSNCQLMLDIIQDKDAFKWGLRVLKVWAKKRGIYGFNFGYLNGITLIIMLVRTHQELLRERKDVYSYDLSYLQLKNTSLPNEQRSNSNINPEDISSLDDLIIDKDLIPENIEPLSQRVTDLIVKFFDMYSRWDFKLPVTIANVNDDWMYDEEL